MTTKIEETLASLKAHAREHFETRLRVKCCNACTVQARIGLAVFEPMCEAVMAEAGRGTNTADMTEAVGKVAGYFLGCAADRSFQPLAIDAVRTAWAIVETEVLLAGAERPAGGLN